jgi:hypothetical protein
VVLSEAGQGTQLTTSLLKAAASGWGRRFLPAHRLLKSLQIVADGHAKGEQLLERLLRCCKAEGDLTGGERDAGREAGEHLIDDGGGRLDGKAGLPSRVEVSEGAGQASSSLVFVVDGFPGGELPQVGEELVARGEAARAGLKRHAGREDLLGAAAADLEDAFDGGAVDPGLGQGIQFGGNPVQVAEPHRFVGHASV